MYDPTIGRWSAVDAMSEKYFGFSPYNYTLNNPVNLIDPDGNEVEELEDRTRYTGNDAVNAFMNFQNGGGDNGGGGKQSSTGGGGEKKTDPLATASKAALAAISLDAAVPDPSDAYLPKWALYGAVSGTILYGPKIIEKVKETLDPANFYYVTYTKTSLDGNLVYVGRSSGFGNPYTTVKNRDAGHHIKGFGPAILTTAAQSLKIGGYITRFDDPAYWAIRGSEQIQINLYKSQGRSANSINGISPSNGLLSKFMEYGSTLFK
jgi:hypothetical protein